jgi:hypothetical protein
MHNTRSAFSLVLLSPSFDHKWLLNPEFLSFTTKPSREYCFLPVSRQQWYLCRSHDTRARLELPVSLKYGTCAGDTVIPSSIILVPQNSSGNQIGIFRNSPQRIVAGGQPNKMPRDLLIPTCPLQCCTCYGMNK